MTGGIKARGRRFLRTPLLALITACGLLLLVGLVTIGTFRWSAQPGSTGLMRDSLIVDYAIPLTPDETTTAVARRYRARTEFWPLLPPAWRAQIEWWLSFDNHQPAPTRVDVDGVQVEPGTVAGPTGQSSVYIVPPRLIGSSTRISIEGQGVGQPKLTLHCDKGYTYKFPAKLEQASLVQVDGTPQSVTSFRGAQTMRSSMQEASAPTWDLLCRPDQKVLALAGNQWAQAVLAAPWPPAMATVGFWMRPAKYGLSKLLTNDDDVTRNRSLDITLEESG